jgi:transglutaminase-like putative cysteine protease
VKRHLLLAMLLLFSMALFGTNYIYATTPNQQNSIITANTSFVSSSTADVNKTGNIQNTTVRTLNEVQTVNNTTKNQQTTTNTIKPVNNSLNLNKSSNSSVNIQSATQAAGNANNSKVQTTTVTYTVSDIKNAASRVKAYIEANLKLPNYVQMGTRQVTMPEFLKLLTAGLIQVKSGLTGSLALNSAVTPKNPTSNVVNGNIYKSEYLTMAGSILSFTNTNRVSPNYASSSLGKIQYKSLVYMYSRIMNYYSTQNVLPNYATMNSWPSTSNSPTTVIPAALQIYLHPTNNCQSNSPTIIALAATITKGSTSTYAKATALFNWVRGNIGYSFYYNTNHGALGTLTSKTANCCDTSNILIALSRAAGIPAKYISADCDFSGTWYGHVFAQIYVGGTWYNADAISYRNTFGVINNWDTSTIIVKGIYAQLPF